MCGGEGLTPIVLSFCLAKKLGVCVCVRKLSIYLRRYTKCLCLY